MPAWMMGRLTDHASLEQETMLGLMVATGCSKDAAEAYIAASGGSIALAVNLWAAQAHSTHAPEYASAMIDAVMNLILGGLRPASGPCMVDDSGSGRRFLGSLAHREEPRVLNPADPLADLFRLAVESTESMRLAVRLFADSYVVALLDSEPELGGDDRAVLYNRRCNWTPRSYSRNLDFLLDMQKGLLPAELRAIRRRDGARHRVEMCVEDYMPRTHAEFLAVNYGGAAYGPNYQALNSKSSIPAGDLLASDMRNLAVSS